MTDPARGEVWTAELDPTRGHEQAGRRPCLVVSDDRYNQTRAGLVILIPITSQGKPMPFRVEINPPEGGLNQKSFILCEMIRSVDKGRLVRRHGAVSAATMAVVEDQVRILLAL